jgi:hypothetical protein
MVALARVFASKSGRRCYAATFCTGKEPPSLDLLLMQRGTAAPDLRAMATRR